MQARPSGGFYKQFIVGTLPYMAPELLRSVRGAAFTASCDVYSLGILLNEVLTLPSRNRDLLARRSNRFASVRSILRQVLTATVPYADALTEQARSRRDLGVASRRGISA